MYRAQRAPSKILQKKWIEKDLEHHQRKVLNARGDLSQSLDATIPIQRKRNKSKQMQQLEESADEQQKRQALKYKKRKQQLNQLQNENLQILKRLQNQTSVYNTASLQLDRIDKEKKLEQLCEYPHIFKQSKRRSEQSEGRHSIQTLQTNTFNNTSHINSQSNYRHSVNYIPQEGDFNYLNKTFTKSNRTAVFPKGMYDSREGTTQPNYRGRTPYSTNNVMQGFAEKNEFSLRGPYMNSLEIEVEDNENNMKEGINERKLSKVMQKYKPLSVAGPEQIDKNRTVLWKQYAYFQNDPETKFLIEISKNKHRFFIVAVNTLNNAFSVIQLYRVQAKKLMRAFDQSFQRLISQLDFKFGKLIITDMTYILQYDPSNSALLQNNPSIIDTNRFTQGAFVRPRNMSQLGVKPSTAGDYPVDQISLNATGGGQNRFGPRSQTRQQATRYSYMGNEFNIQEQKLGNFVRVKFDNQKFNHTTTEIPTQNTNTIEICDQANNLDNVMVPTPGYETSKVSDNIRKFIDQQQNIETLQS